MTQPAERFNLRRFLLSGAGWPYLLVPFIPIAIALELAHASAAVDLRRLRARRDPDRRADGPGDRGARGALRPGHRRLPQRHLRQRARADHRLLRAARGPAGGRQGLAGRLDPRQHPARDGRRDARRRPQARAPDVRPHRRQRAVADAAAGRRRADHAGDLPARGRRRPAEPDRPRPSSFPARPRADVGRRRRRAARHLRRRPDLLAADPQGPLQPRARRGGPRRRAVVGAQERDRCSRSPASRSA